MKALIFLTILLSCFTLSNAQGSAEEFKGTTVVTMQIIHTVPMPYDEAIQAGFTTDLIGTKKQNPEGFILMTIETYTIGGEKTGEPSTQAGEKEVESNLEDKEKVLEATDASVFVITTDIIIFRNNGISIDDQEPVAKLNSSI